MLSKLRIAVVSLQMRRFSTNTPLPTPYKVSTKLLVFTSGYIIAAVIGGSIAYATSNRYHRQDIGKLLVLCQVNEI